MNSTRKSNPDARLFAVGLALGALLLLFFVGLAYVLDLPSGFFGVPPAANHFLHS
jgi:hypothetical protein